MTEQQITTPLLELGLILTAGYLAGRAANYLRLPRVSGYIVAGLAFSPSILGIFTMPQLDTLFAITSDIALAIIAYSIGGSLRMTRIRELGREILWINVAEGTGAFIMTVATIYLAGFFLFPFTGMNGGALTSIALIMGGIAVATAPAATMAVIHELRATGPLTITLLGVVALDDALSIIIFSVSLAVAGWLSGAGPVDGMFTRALLTIGGAPLVGLVVGFLFSRLLNTRNRPEINLMLSLAAVFLTSGLAVKLHTSALLADMMLGFVIINTVQHADDLFHQLDLMEETIFCLFFSLAAAHFDLKALGTSALLGFILLIGRFVGKLGGTFLGAKLSRAPALTARYLGITLMPQAGLSLGLIFLAKPVILPDHFNLLLSALLASVIMNEIISPPLVKWALTAAGESKTDE